jgi:hypothetical protein
VDRESDTLRQALRRLPVPEPRPGFVDRALRTATEQNSLARKTGTTPSTWLRSFASRWETWAGAALGAAMAVAITVMVLRPLEHGQSPVHGIAFDLHEARDVDVLIDSERDLDGAVIRIALTGGIALNGFDDDHQLQWQTDLRRGSNMLSLPLVARSAGNAQLVAVIEHEGKTREVTINLTVRDSKISRS